MPGGALYKVRVGSFESRSNADNLAVEPNGRGYPTFTKSEQVNGRTVYHVQVGAYEDEKQARERQRELQANGYDSTLSTGR